jgi:hypothetical protein
MNIQLEVPTEWSDVTLGEFLTLSKLDLESFTDPIDYYVKVLRVFGNDVTNIAEYIKMTDANKIAQLLSFMNEQPKGSDIKEVTIDKVKYYLPINMNELTLGEVVSIETLIERDKLTSVDAIDAVLSVILRPKGEEFDSNKIESRRRLFKGKLNIEEVLGMSVFFSIGVR